MFTIFLSPFLLITLKMLHWHFQRLKFLLIHFSPMSHFYTISFQKFPEDKEMKHWAINGLNLCFKKFFDELWMIVNMKLSILDLFANKKNALISEWIHTTVAWMSIQLPKCLRNPSSKQVQYMRFKWLQPVSNPQTLSP